MKFNQIPDFLMAGCRAAVVYGLRTRTFIACTLLIAAPGSDAWSNTLPTDFSRLDTYIQSQLESAGIPGAAVVVVSKDKVLHMRGFGISGPGGKTPTPQTLFMPGSVSKSFTALAVMQLVEAGKIGLDVPVINYIPWFQLADPVPSGQITVRQLLNQNSGFSTLNGSNYCFANCDRSDIALEHSVRELRNVKLNAPPGTHWEYSNINYVILGYLIQRISGEPYDKYIERHVFGPLGMRNSVASDKLGKTADLATGYRYWFGKAVPAYELPYQTSLVPAGYLFTSAEDMGRYLMAHLNGGMVDGISIISSSGIDTLHQSSVPVIGNDRYAMGWYFNSAVPNFFEHNGGLPNFFSQMAIDAKEGWGVALLVNADNMLSGPAIQSLGVQVENILRGREPAAIKKGSMFSPALIALFGLLLVHLIIGFWIIRRISKWRTFPESLPKTRTGWMLNGLLPPAIGLILTIVYTVVVPRENGINLAGLLLFAPDAGLLLILNVCLALIVSLACTYFVFINYFRKFARP